MFNWIAIWIVGSFGIWVLYGLLALWISSRRWHWSVRIAILMTSVAPILAIEAPDLMLMLLASNLVIFGPVAYVAGRATKELDDSRDAQPFVRWSVTDLLLGTALAAGMISLLNVDLAGQDVLRLTAIVFGVVVGVSQLIGIAIGRSQFRWRVWLAALMGLGLLVVLWYAFINGTDAVQFTIAGGALAGSTSVPLVSVAVVIAHLVFYYHARLRAIESGKDDSRLRTRLSNLFVVTMWWGSVLGMTFIALLAGALYCELLCKYEDTQPVAVTEGTNGYHALVDAGEAFSKSQIFDGPVDFLPGTTVRQEIQAYASTFDAVEEALGQPLLVSDRKGKLDPIDPFSGYMDGMMHMRSIARALRVKSRQALDDGDADTALAEATRCMKLRMPLSRSQLMVGELIGIAVEGIGADAAYAALKDASVDALETSLQVLQELEALPIDFSAIQDKEQKLLWQKGNWKYRLAILSAHEDSNDLITLVLKRSVACRRQLMLAICLELDRRETVELPKSLDELVPKYLEQVPEDPFGLEKAQAIKYRRDQNDDGYTLYSIGTDGEDNGGVLDPEYQYWEAEGSDINFAERCRVNREEFLRDAQPDPIDSAEGDE